MRSKSLSSFRDTDLSIGSQIVLGSIAAKCPGMPFARSALANLQVAYDLFAVVRENDRAIKVLVRDLRSDCCAILSIHHAS